MYHRTAHGNQGRTGENTAGPLRFSRRRLIRSEAGVTLVETLVSLMVIVVGLAGAFATSAQCYGLLRRAKAIVAAREDILSRLDTIRTLSFTQVAQSNYISATMLVSGAAGDPSPFGTTTDGMLNFTETVTIYALGSQVFSSDSQRSNATPDSVGEYASQFKTPAPAPPATYISTGTSAGAWAPQTGANALPYIKVIRAGTGSSAITTVITAGDLTSYPQLRVDVTYTWKDSKNLTQTQVGSTIVSNSGSLL